MSYKIHATITQSRVLDLAQDASSSLDNPGLCLACGEDAEGMEPDARKSVCECCGKRCVYGAEEILLCGYYHTDTKVTGDETERLE